MQHAAFPALIGSLAATYVRAGAVDRARALLTVRRHDRSAQVHAKVMMFYHFGVSEFEHVAIFSAVRAVLIDDLPYHEPDRIVRMWQNVQGVVEPGLSLDDMAALRRGAPALQAIGATNLAMGPMRGQDGATQIAVFGVTGDFFEVFGVRPSLGRPLQPGDAGANVIVISDRLWRSHLRAADDAIGQVVHVDHVPYVIVGVMPAGFAPTFTADRGVLWRPLGATEGNGLFTIFARLAPGATMEHAGAQVNAVMKPRGRNMTFAGKDVRRYLGMTVERLGEADARYAQSGLLLLQGIAVLLLIVTCANVANLSLANASARQRELVVRTALGATRGRLVRQLLTESTVIAIGGALVGVAVAYWAAPALFSEPCSLL
jgi:ABC-type antimicrobial peptide transport system permease subunit